MFCSECQNILNLDILLRTHKDHEANGGEAKPYPYDEGFKTLEQSAKTGFELCKLVCSVPSCKELDKLRAVTGAEAKLFFEFGGNDVVHFRTLDENSLQTNTAFFWRD